MKVSHLPPDEAGLLLVRHVDLHEIILYEVLRRRQPGIPQQLPQNAILFNSGHSFLPSAFSSLIPGLLRSS